MNQILFMNKGMCINYKNVLCNNSLLDDPVTISIVS